MYGPYVPHPRKLKAISDSSLALAEELSKMKVNKKLLKIRERRLLALAKHFLENYFGSPYKDNYYTGKSWCFITSYKEYVKYGLINVLNWKGDLKKIKSPHKN